MGRVLLHKCTGCGEYNLTEKCRECGGKAIQARPAKFSPEDHYGEYRRKLKVQDREEQKARKTDGAGR